MENQVLTTQQMKHLKELGVDTSNASMKLISNYPSSDCYDYTVYVAVDKSFHSKMYNERGSVFTLQDILELLPKKIKDDKNNEYLILIDPSNVEWEVSYANLGGVLASKYSKSLLDAAYKMLCWCAENSYLTIK